MSVSTASDAGRPAKSRRPLGWLHLGWVRRGATLLAFVAALEYLVLPQIAGTRAALHVLDRVQPG
jgi:hypothetical protein